MPTNNMDIRKDDRVLVIAGKDRSYVGNQRRGRVIGVLPKERRLIVDGINIMKRAVRQSQKVRQGGIIEGPGPIDVSNVMLICPSCDQPTRVGHRRDDGRRTRVCKRCGADIDD